MELVYDTSLGLRYHWRYDISLAVYQGKRLFLTFSFFVVFNFDTSKCTVGRQFVPSDNSSQTTIRPKFQKATIRPKRQFVPSDNSSQTTIRPKRQFVPNSKKRQFVPSDNSSQTTIRPKFQIATILGNCFFPFRRTIHIKTEKRFFQNYSKCRSQYVDPYSNLPIGTFRKRLRGLLRSFFGKNEKIHFCLQFFFFKKKKNVAASMPTLSKKPKNFNLMFILTKKERNFSCSYLYR